RLGGGFAVGRQGSLVLPLVDPTSGEHPKWAWFWLARILKSELVKVFHNGMFDTFLLRWHHLPVHKWRWDTLGEHHLLDPADRHTLAYCARPDLPTGFSKEQAEEPEVRPGGGGGGGGGGGERGRGGLRPCFWGGGGRAPRHTIELHLIYKSRLAEAGLLPVYRAHYKRTMWAGLDLSLEGMTVDHQERDRL